MKKERYFCSDIFRSAWTTWGRRGSRWPAAAWRRRRTASISSSRPTPCTSGRRTVDTGSAKTFFRRRNVARVVSPSLRQRQRKLLQQTMNDSKRLIHNEYFFYWSSLSSVGSNFKGSVLKLKNCRKNFLQISGVRNKMLRSCHDRILLFQASADNRMIKFSSHVWTVLD